MKDYSIKLAKSADFSKLGQISLSDSNIKLAFSVFLKDGDNKSNADKFSDILNYFIQKEKEISSDSKKGDSILTKKDMEEIIKDSKFSELREAFNDDSKAA